MREWQSLPQASHVYVADSVSVCDGIDHDYHGHEMKMMMIFVIVYRPCYQSQPARVLPYPPCSAAS